MSMQDYEQRYFYNLKMTDKTGSSNKSTHHIELIVVQLTSHSQPNKSEVRNYCRPLILPQKKFSTTPNSKKVSTNKCVINREAEIAVWPSKPEVLISATVCMNH